MKHFWQILLLSIALFHNVVSSCRFSKEEIVCNRPAEIIAEGNTSWTNLMLYSDLNLKFDLTKNTFKRTPNLIKLTLTAVESIQPGALSTLKELDKLIFYKTDFEEISREIVDNLPIRTLQVFETKLKYLSPGFFDNLLDISLVDLRHNKIEKINAGVFNNTPIYKLYLNHNRIGTIENNAFINMPDLIYLNLGANNIKTFNSKILLGTSLSLNQLWLDRNQFTKITKNMFTTIPNLLNLYLEINQINDIEAETFYKTPLLDFIDLSNNNLTEIDTKCFPAKGFKQLRLIFLHNNRLTFINKEFFEKLPNLQYISYGGNPLQCPCLNNITEWSSKNISRICDDDYMNGKRPACVIYEQDPLTCLYDTKLSKDIYDKYLEVAGTYPSTHKKCDTTTGVKNAFLGFVD